MKKLNMIMVALLTVNIAFSQDARKCSTCLSEGIQFTAQSQIDSFQVNYPNCKKIRGDLTISGSNILNLDGLGVLTSIGGGLYINYNDSLSSLRGLDNLVSIGDELDIWCNNALTSMTGLDHLVYIGFDLWITGNYSLDRMTGLNNLTSIGGQLRINSNINLTTLEGLNNLASIGRQLRITDNNTLTNLRGLDNLTNIVTNLWIDGNASLTTLEGLDSIDAASIADLYIYENSSLASCTVKSICDYVTSPNGTVEIHDNAAGCNSGMEVEAACAAGVDESAFKSQRSAVIIFPNPSFNTITIELPDLSFPHNNTTFTISSINGQEILIHQITEPMTVVDVSEWVSGLYYVKIVGDDGVKVGKFVKE
jgi:hypothetical protein